MSVLPTLISTILYLGKLNQKLSVGTLFVTLYCNRKQEEEVKFSVLYAVSYFIFIPTLHIILKLRLNNTVKLKNSKQYLK